MEDNFNNRAIDPKNNENEQVSNKKNTFNLVIGIATLLIALLGATFAYFSATARSREGDVTVKSAYVSISYDGGTEIKATNLIPATQQVALSKYQKPGTPYNAETDGEINGDYDSYKNDPDRRCVDAKGKEVCYVYQFSVTSDGVAGENTDILPTVEVNKNEFFNLSYVLYEVNLKKDPNDSSKVLTDKYGIGVIDDETGNGWTLVSKFTKMDENPDNTSFNGVGFNQFEQPQDVYGEDGNLDKIKKPVSCLFQNSDDFSDKDIEDTSRCSTMAISNKVKHTYQLVIWLEETGEVQDEQGKSFEGTVSIEVSGGLDSNEYGNGKITGQQ